ncbi:SAM-dependent methyltransferase [Carboxydochorda subterranea]|uniref:S-adenosyl-L-methionine-dependent methyltransferase n=1 Tax=Carboxydichorda subterranea TaxID=3109565 RepID=A0ABZ1BTD1_9FIRM|nr:SAM-dependent methyltransferase [Limnochorda sp. L945t]WRP16075.1 SAM-dependent methyltransferase [Limnochorda sp. L945t]
MSGQNVGNTALGAATCRLIEQYQPKHFRLFVDPVVGDLVGGLIRTLMRSAWMRRVAVRRMEGMLPGLYGAQVCRTRYIDDVVQSGTGHGIDQLVLLGAGLDTRPYRLPGVGGVTVFELDLPALQVRKQARLRNCLRSLPDNVRFVPVDFDVDDLGTILAKAGFDRSRPAVFVWEGVTQYITEARAQDADLRGRLRHRLYPRVHLCPTKRRRAPVTRSWSRCADGLLDR